MGNYGDCSMAVATDDAKALQRAKMAAYQRARRYRLGLSRPSNRDFAQEKLDRETDREQAEREGVTVEAIRWRRRRTAQTGVAPPIRKRDAAQVKAEREQAEREGLTIQAIR
jgi:hypothetical protein